jgi:hypothetical protein
MVPIVLRFGSFGPGLLPRLSVGYKGKGYDCIVVSR